MRLATVIAVGAVLAAACRRVVRRCCAAARAGRVHRRCGTQRRASGKSRSRIRRGRPGGGAALHAGAGKARWAGITCRRPPRSSSCHRSIERPPDRESSRARRSALRRRAARARCRRLRRLRNRRRRLRCGARGHQRTNGDPGNHSRRLARERSLPSTAGWALRSVCRSAASVSPSEAERIIDKYRGALGGPPVRVYLACSQNGLTPCVEGHSSGEAAALLGAINVGWQSRRVGARPLTLDEIRERGAGRRDRSQSQRREDALRAATRVAAGSGRRGGARLRSARPAVQLGSTAAFRQSLAGPDLARVRVRAAGRSTKSISTTSAAFSRRSTTSHRARSNCVR